MVALMRTKPREPRHYSCGPPEDIPLRVYEPPAKVPWWIEVTFAAGFVFVILVPAVAAFIMFVN